MEFQIRFHLEVNHFHVRFLQHHQKQQLQHQMLTIIVMVNFQKHRKSLNFESKEVSVIYYALQMMASPHLHPKSKDGGKVLKDKIKISTTHLLKITKESQWRDKMFQTFSSATEILKTLLTLLKMFHYSKIIIQEYRAQFHTNYHQNIQR